MIASADRCEVRTSGVAWTYPRCKYRWAVRVTLRNGEVVKVCRVHLRPLNRSGEAVEITSGPADARSGDAKTDRR